MRAAPQRGLSLILCLVFLVVMSTMAMAMFRSFGLLELIAGNTMDKQRAFEAAQSAMRYGEWWISTQSSPPPLTNCAGVVDANVVAALPVCTTGIAQLDTLPWTPARIDYTPNYMTVSPGGGLAANGDVNYSARPSLHIQYLGTQSDGVGQVYQVTAVGAGGNGATVSMVQSAFELNTPIKDLGGQ